MHSSLMTCNSSSLMTHFFTWKTCGAKLPLTCVRQSVSLTRWWWLETGMTGKCKVLTLNASWTERTLVFLVIDMYIFIFFFSVFEPQLLISPLLPLGHASLLIHSLFVSQISSNTQHSHPKIISINLLSRFGNNLSNRKVLWTSAGQEDHMKDKLQCLTSVFWTKRWWTKHYPEVIVFYRHLIGLS